MVYKDFFFSKYILEFKSNLKVLYNNLYSKEIF
jgi:hypothetical protein